MELPSYYYSTGNDSDVFLDFKDADETVEDPPQERTRDDHTEGPVASANDLTSVTRQGAELENTKDAEIVPHPDDPSSELSRKGVVRKQHGITFIILGVLLVTMAIGLSFLARNRSRRSKEQSTLTTSAGDTILLSPTIAPSFSVVTASPVAALHDDDLIFCNLWRCEPTVASAMPSVVSGVAQEHIVFAPQEAPSSSPTRQPTKAPLQAPTVSPSRTPSVYFPTEAPTSIQSTLIVPALKNVVQQSNLLDNPNTVSGKAAEWMRSQSTVHLENEDRIAQRYALTLLDMTLGVNVADPAAEECDWEGVECVLHVLESYSAKNSTDYNAVQSVVWPGNALRGTIPADIALLSNLKVLDLSNNNIMGTIPEHLYNLTHLEKLFLNRNKLEGRLSKKISNLKNLTRLYLGENSLTGSIPDEIGSLESGGVNSRPLEWISLYDNRLIGTIPQRLNLKELFYLDLGKNQLTGTIPPMGSSAVDALNNLRHLHLDHNQLTGSLPDDWLTLGNERIQQIILNNNALTGEVPGKYSNENSLAAIELYHNAFSEIEEDICNLSVFNGGGIVVFRADCEICYCDAFCDADMCDM